MIEHRTSIDTSSKAAKSRTVILHKMTHSTYNILTIKHTKAKYLVLSSHI